MAVGSGVRDGVGVFDGVGVAVTILVITQGVWEGFIVGGGFDGVLLALGVLVGVWYGGVGPSTSPITTGMYVLGGLLAA